MVVGYLAGESYETVSGYLGKATGAVLVLLVAVVVIVLVGRWLGRNPDPVRALLGRARALPPVRWLTGRYGVLFFLLAMHIGPGWTLLLNLVAGLGLLFASGLGLAFLVDVVVRQSGLYVVDHAIETVVRRAAGRTDTVDAATSRAQRVPGIVPDHRGGPGRAAGRLAVPAVAGRPGQRGGHGRARPCRWSCSPWSRT